MRAHALPLTFALALLASPVAAECYDFHIENRTGLTLDRLGLMKPDDPTTVVTVYRDLGPNESFQFNECFVWYDVGVVALTTTGDFYAQGPYPAGDLWVTLTPSDWQPE